MVIGLLVTALGAFLGAALSLFASIATEYQRKPKLKLSFETPPRVQTNPDNAPAKHSKFLRVYVTNRPMTRSLSWLGRSAAYQATGDIQFYHLDDGAPVFARAMPIRWSGSDEPVSYQLVNGEIQHIFDPAKYNAAFRRDCFPGLPELVDVAARFDSDEDCFGWSNESYLKGWRNPEFKLPKGRYLVRITIRSSGDNVSGVFKLENSVGVEHFRLLTASKDEAARLRVNE